PRVLVPPLQRSRPPVLSPPDKCPPGSEPTPSRQRRLKFVSSKPPIGRVGHSLRFFDQASPHHTQEPAEGSPSSAGSCVPAICYPLSGPRCVGRGAGRRA